jgi:hypothetical protein
LRSGIKECAVFLTFISLKIHALDMIIKFQLCKFLKTLHPGEIRTHDKRRQTLDINFTQIHALKILIK